MEGKRDPILTIPNLLSLYRLAAAPVAATGWIHSGNTAARIMVATTMTNQANAARRSRAMPIAYGPAS